MTIKRQAMHPLFSHSFNQYYAYNTWCPDRMMWPLTVNSVIASQRRRRHK